MILGIVPASTEPPWDRVSVYYPTLATSRAAGLNSRYLTVIGRLAPDASAAGAQQELDRLGARLHLRFPELSARQVREAGFRMVARPLHDAAVAPVHAELRLLGLMVAALLLIAVANVATLTLLRAERLRGEVGVSRALGASGGAILRRFVIEADLLALAGAVLALPCAALALSARFGFAAGDIPRLEGATITPGIGASVVLLALVIGGLLGGVAAARVRGAAPGRAGDLDRRSTPARGWRRVQASLVTLQVAFALTLLIGAAVLGLSLIRLQRVDLGFRPEEKTTFSLFVPGSAYSSWQRIIGFHARVESALRSLPGVTAAASAMQLPSTPQLLYVHPRLEATRRDGRATQALVTMNVVSPGFFQLMGIPIRAGREFQRGDLATPEPGVVVSASLARSLFGAEDPIGREVRLAASGRWRFPAYRVVGVSGDVYGERVTDGVLRVLYFPLVPELPADLDMPIVPAGIQFVVRSPLSAAELAPGFKAVVGSIDPRVPLWGVRTLGALVGDTMARTRLTMLLLGVAALATLLLAAIGLYSVIAFAVAARTREFAVRLALGTTPGSLTRLVLGRGAVLAGLGVLTGLGLSLAGARLLRSVVFEVSPTDPRLYLVGTVAVLTTTGAAALLPARRAGRVDPAEALRAE